VNAGTRFDQYKIVFPASVKAHGSHSTLFPLAGLMLETFKCEIVLADMLQDVPIGVQ
jgi:hypothetical protein